jgi:hypothetical protein
MLLERHSNNLSPNIFQIVANDFLGVSGSLLRDFLGIGRSGTVNGSLGETGGHFDLAF